jgi:hypothetical protein
MPRAYLAAARRTPLWRAFAASDCTAIDQGLARGERPCCPGCATTLEARPGTRMAAFLPDGVAGFDLECRWCRRFRCVVRRTGRAEQVQRMRRLAAAVAVAGARPARRRMAVAA